jgi:pimeloyl-ACP methyl ester carboxylesterase
MFPGITARTVRTPRLGANVLERAAAGEPAASVVFVHGNVSSSVFYQPTMLALPPGVRALAVDLRGFGESETLPVDATRGVRDFCDDVWSVLDALDIVAAHLVGWSMGGGIVMQMLLDAPSRVLSLTLEAPVSPYGFGGTRGPDGTANNADASGTGGGGANQDFVARLAAGDTGDDPMSPRGVFRSSYTAAPQQQAEHEDEWVASMLSTKTGPDNYPGDAAPSQNWPGFAPGTRGVLNTMAPTYFNTSGIVDLAVKPPILWIHGDLDAIVSDESFFDLNTLGKHGIIPGWPGEEVAPPQPMVAQTRAVLARYQANGGTVREVTIPGAGHSPHLDAPDTFNAELAGHIA